MGVCLFTTTWVIGEITHSTLSQNWIMCEPSLMTVSALHFLCFLGRPAPTKRACCQAALQEHGALTESLQIVWLMLFCSDWLMRWVACVSGAAGDDAVGCISQLCLEGDEQREFMHMHGPPVHGRDLSHTHTHTRTFRAQRWMHLEMHYDYSSGASGVPRWHGNSSLNTTNHRQGSMLIKTKAYADADGTSHHIVFTLKLLELLPISNDWW